MSEVTTVETQEVAGKIKLQDLIKAYGTGDQVPAILTETAPRFENQTEEEVLKTLGITSTQMARTEKKLMEKVANQLAADITGALIAGGSIELPGGFNIFVHNSTANTNEDGTPKKKLSIKTREPMKRALNSSNKVDE